MLMSRHQKAGQNHDINVGNNILKMRSSDVWEQHNKSIAFTKKFRAD